MRAMIWKELREQLKWGIGGLVLFSVAPMVMLNKQWFGLQGRNFFTDGDYSMFLSFGAPVLGLLLGFLQIHAERSRDLRSFLLHRPLSISRIFLAKVMVGLILLVGAFGIPLIMVHYWESGRSLPGLFTWEMILPRLSDLGNGWICYLGALLTMQRRARWYASRTLGLIVAGLATILVVETCRTFWQATMVQILFTLLILPAAWGTFLADGEDAEMPRWIWGNHLTIHLTGMFLVVAFVVMGIANVLHVTQGIRPGSIKYEVMKDGRIVETLAVGTNGNTRWTSTYLDALDTDPEGPLNPPWLIQHRIPSTTAWFSLVKSADRSWTTYRQYTHYFQKGSRHGRLFAFNQGSRLIHVIDLTAREHLGYIDQDGMHSDLASASNPFPERLSGPNWNFNLFVTPRFIWRIDPTTFQVKKLLEAQGGEAWRSWKWNLDLSESEKLTHFHVVSDRRYIIFDALGHLLVELPYITDLSDYYAVSGGWVPDQQQYFLQFHPNPGIEPVFTWHSADGVLAETRRLPPGTIELAHPSTSHKMVLAMAVPSGLLALTYVADDDREQYSWNLISMVALLCGMTALTLSRKDRERPMAQVGWLLLGLLGGVAGLLTMLALRTRRPIQHHGTKAPSRPVTDGTEIFEPLGSGTSLG